MAIAVKDSDIGFTKVALPYGWLGNMSPHPVWHLGRTWLTTEALFQALRFRPERENLMHEVWKQKSPMAAKMVSKRLRNEYPDSLGHQPLDVVDLGNMQLMLRLKIAQHTALRRQLLDTGDRLIFEDIGARKGARHEFWGARRQGGEWVGQNHLGRMWMELRSELAADLAILDPFTKTAQMATL